MSDVPENRTMLLDIESQSEALTEAIAVARTRSADVKALEFQRVFLTGSGDSYIAAVATQPLFQSILDRPVIAIRSLDASRYASIGRGDLVIVLSVSGEAIRTVEVAHRLITSGAIGVGITASVDSTLASLCDAVIKLPDPIDRMIPHSRDYSVMLAALACLLEAIGDEHFAELDRLPRIMAEVVSRSLESVRLLDPTTGRTWFLGAGADRATAMFGALKFWEAAGMEAWWDDLEEFAHGSQLMARPGDRAVLVAAGPGMQRACEMTSGLMRMGLGVVRVGGTQMGQEDAPHLFTTNDLDHRWHPFVACVPLQALTYIEAHARGLDVSVPLFGQPHGPIYNEVHLDWVRRSRIMQADANRPTTTRAER